MEYRDIYNAAGQRTGKVVSKNTPLEPGELLLVVGCWIVSPRGDIFLTRRSPTKSFAPDLWENTGGHAMTGEDGRTAILREIREETGIICTQEDLIPLYHCIDENSVAEEYAAVLDFPLEEVVLQEGETCDAAWVSEDKWESMLASGEIAPTVNEKLLPFKEKLLQVIHSLKK